jgi:hypothetical protein
MIDCGQSCCKKIGCLTISNRVCSYDLECDFKKKSVFLWFLSIERSKSTQNTTNRSFWRSICYRQPETSLEKTIFAFSKTKLHPIQQRLSRSGVQKICQMSSLKDEWSPSSQDFFIWGFMLAHEDLGSYSTRIISVARANRLRSTFDWLSSSSAKLLKSVKFFKYHIYVL